MKLYSMFVLCSLTVLLFIVQSCSTEKPKVIQTEPATTVEEERIPSSQVEIEQQDKVEPVEPVEEVTIPEDSETGPQAPEPVIESEPEEAVDQEPEKQPEITEVEDTSEEVSQSDDKFQVSEDVFKQTFFDIELLIQELNSIIESEDYETWQQYLTPGYKEKMSSREVLDKLSDQPMLKKYNIKLKTLKDYFSYVVVPSRSNARLDDLVFVNENNVKAIMVISGQRSILYKLERTGNSWKIGIF